jgi:SAM-dependent methyltransferase
MAMGDPRTTDFFAQHFFGSWLTWISESGDSAAAALRAWLAAEESALHQALADFETGEQSGPGVRLLDAGTGFGRHVVAALCRHPNWSATAIDSDASMLASGRALARERGISTRVRFLRGDMTRLGDQVTDRFDCAMCVNALGVLSHDGQGALAKQLFRVVRPKGHVVVSAYSEASVATRLRSYEAVGLEVRVDGCHIVSTEGLRSEAFSPSSLSSPFLDAGFLPLEDVCLYERIGLVGRFYRPDV